LIQRENDRPHKPGQWDIPGGRLDHGEDLYAGLRRETQEEAGMDIEILAPVDLHHFVRDDGQQIAMLIFLCAPKSKEVRLSHEHKAYKWQDISDRSGFPTWLQAVLEIYEKNHLSEVQSV